MITEESVVAKVEELMETLDLVKRYNVLTRSLKKFTLFIMGSMIIFAIVIGMFGSFELRLTLNSSFSFLIDDPVFFLITLLSFLILVMGIFAGVMFVRRRVNSVRVGEWREELSHGFPSALKILMELDWDKTLDEISVGKLSYAVYSLLKTAAYLVITFFALEVFGNALVFFFLGRTNLFIVFFLGLLSLLLVFLFLGRDIFRRYKELQALDMLLLELRWFSLEIRRADFKT